MSELTAKHKALNILRVLTAEEVPNQLSSRSQDQSNRHGQGSSQSQGILAAKYEELAALLAIQHTEQKMVSRLGGLAVSRSGPLGNRVRTQRRQHRRSLERSAPAKSCLEGSASVRDQSVSCSKHLSKTVSFADSRLVCSDDPSSDVSDAEIIRRIVRSPRKDGDVQARSPALDKGRTVLKKRKCQKATSSPREVTATKKSSSEDTSLDRKSSFELKSRQGKAPKPARSADKNQKPKGEVYSSDHQLNTSTNPDVLSWLKDKNKISRKERRLEKQKERYKMLAERIATEEKIQRLQESEEKVTEWLKHKQGESLLQRRVEKKVRKILKQKDVAKENSEETQAKQSQRKTKSAEGETNRHHLERNLVAGRPHEEKGQLKKVQRRQRRLLRSAGSKTEVETESKTKAKSTEANSRTEDSANIYKPSVIKNATEIPEKVTSKVEKTPDKSRPSSNPFKGLTYEQWLKEKQQDQRQQAKKKAERGNFTDPELDELIPLLARRRIEQIKVRAKRVDSGLRRSVEERNTDEQTFPIGARAYTWAPSMPNTWTTSGGNDEHSTKGRGSHREDSKTPVGSEHSMPDLVSFERLEPQAAKNNQSNESIRNKNQSDLNNNTLQSTLSIGSEETFPQNEEDSNGEIFLTEMK